MNDETSVTIKLSRPLRTKDGGTVEEISLREPVARDIRVASKRSGDDMDQEIHLIANLAMLHFDDIDSLPVRDLAKVQSALKGFFFQKEETA